MILRRLSVPIAIGIPEMIAISFERDVTTLWFIPVQHT